MHISLADVPEPCSCIFRSVRFSQHDLTGYLQTAISVYSSKDRPFLQLHRFNRFQYLAQDGIQMHDHIINILSTEMSRTNYTIIKELLSRSCSFTIRLLTKPTTEQTVGSTFGIKGIKQVYEPWQDKTTHYFRSTFIRHHINNSEENCTSTREDKRRKGQPQTRCGYSQDNSRIAMATHVRLTAPTKLASSLV
jgi:hypothetical protein